MRTIFLTILIGCALQAQTVATGNWDRQAAAAYLDGRMGWWASWPSAARDSETFCVSCHTSLPYALARPALRTALAEQNPSGNERLLLQNVSRRVSLWDELQPFYSDAKNGAPKSAESRGVEAVLNALILARYQAPDAEDALRNMWALQVKTGEGRGSWIWLNFHNEPWEADDSAFLGAALAGLAVGQTPAEYRNRPAIQESVELLAGYLEREQKSQSTLNRAMALWASANLTPLLNAKERGSIIEEILSKQREDGGWSASSLVLKEWKRRDGTPMDTDSDGFGTGLMVIALEQSAPSSAQEPIARGLAWIVRNQDKSGAWLNKSMNKKRDPESDAGRFMNDAATAYAVLALSGH